jgi:UDP-N-acetylglucosamine 4-epimerase
MKRNTWFITGGAGFIGSHLILKLLELNVKVICVDISSKNIFAMKAWLAKNISRKKFNNLTVYRNDISDFTSVNKIINKHKFSVLVNLAAISSISEATKKPQKLFEINVLGFLNLLESINSKITKKIIYASSSSVYGKYSTKKNTENQKLFPISRYGVSKLLCEQISEIYSAAKNTEIIGMRFFNIYGERQIFKGDNSGVIPKWVHALKYNKKISLKQTF